MLRSIAPVVGREYWDNMWELCSSPRTRQLYFRYLATLDISDFRPGVLPDTQVQREAQVSARHKEHARAVPSTYW